MILLALIKKILRIESPSCQWNGYKYEYDYIRDERRRRKVRKNNENSN